MNMEPKDIGETTRRSMDSGNLPEGRTNLSKFSTWGGREVYIARDQEGFEKIQYLKIGNTSLKEAVISRVKNFISKVFGGKTTHKEEYRVMAEYIKVPTEDGQGYKFQATKGGKGVPPIKITIQDDNYDIKLGKVHYVLDRPIISRTTEDLLRQRRQLQEDRRILYDEIKAEIDDLKDMAALKSTKTTGKKFGPLESQYLKDLKNIRSKIIEYKKQINLADLNQLKELRQKLIDYKLQVALYKDRR